MANKKGGPGRKPIPTNLKILNGNPGKRPLPANEPKPVPIAPKCPSWLHKDAKAEWKRIAPQLERLGLLTQIDMAMLAAYCEYWAAFKTNMEFLHDKGFVFPVKDADGTIKSIRQFPQWSAANVSFGNMRSVCSEFGMTPAERARMVVPGTVNEEDEMEKLLSGIKRVK